MKRTPILRAAMSSRSTSSAEATRIGRVAPPRRARSGSASSAALAPPHLVMSARKVRGPTFSDRTRRSQSKRCWSVRRGSGFFAIGSSFSARFSNSAPLRRRTMLALCFTQISAESAANASAAPLSPGRRHGDGRNERRRQGRRGGVARRGRDREPDNDERDRRRPGEANEGAKIGRHALAAAELEPDRVHMAEDRARRGREPSRRPKRRTRLRRPRASPSGRRAAASRPRALCVRCAGRWSRRYCRSRSSASRPPRTASSARGRRELNRDNSRAPAPTPRRKKSRPCALPADAG